MTKAANTTTSKTNAASKVASKARAPRTSKAKQTAPEQNTAPVQTSTIAQNLLAALNARMVALSQLDATAQASQQKQLAPVIAHFSVATIDSAVAKMNQTDFDRVATIIASADAKVASNYMQVKSIVKMFDMIDRVGMQLKARSNNFNACVSAMVLNGNKASISDLIVAQCKKAREARATSEGFTVRSQSYTIGTASSQSGQVRDVLRVLNLASVVKNASNDTATLSEYGVSILAPVYAELSE